MTTLGAQHQAGGKDKKVSSFFTQKKIFFVCLKKVCERKMISSKTKIFLLYTMKWNCVRTCSRSFILTEKCVQRREKLGKS